MTKTEMDRLLKAADDAGRKAADAKVPTPMYVVERASPLDDNSPIVKRYAPVMGGVCGFAWVNVKPGNSRLANYMKAKGLARTDGYYGGVTLWVSRYGQSMELKEAYARAFAGVLSDAGIRAYADSRMD
jgi:hypothetical protein